LAIVIGIGLGGVDATTLFTKPYDENHGVFSGFGDWECLGGYRRNVSRLSVESASVA